MMRHLSAPLLFSAALTTATITGSATEPPPSARQPAATQPGNRLATDVAGLELQTEDQMASYIAGIGQGSKFRQLGQKPEMALFLRGFLEGYTDRLSLSKEQLGQMVDHLKATQSAESTAVATEMARLSSIQRERFLQQAGVVTTASGLSYRPIESTHGRRPTPENHVLVRSRTTLPTGKVLEDTLRTGAPLSFVVGAVIAGWSEGLQLMPEGSTYEFLIPAKLAYGAQGRGKEMPGSADLLLVIKLLKIE